jgi:hypothetical protein
MLSLSYHGSRLRDGGQSAPIHRPCGHAGARSLCWRELGPPPPRSRLGHERHETAAEAVRKFTNSEVKVGARLVINTQSASPNVCLPNGLAFQPQPSRLSTGIRMPQQVPAVKWLRRCAGINRHGERNERVRHRRPSEPRWPRVMHQSSQENWRSVDRGKCRQGIEPREANRPCWSERSVRMYT